MSLLDEYNNIGRNIIGAAFDIRKIAGRALREKYYEAALAYELTKRGFEVERQFTIPALYCGEVIDDAYMADIVVNNKVIVEVKAVTTMNERECRQLLTYLHLSEYKLGYLINFGSKNFIIGDTREKLPYTQGIYRFVNQLH